MYIIVSEFTSLCDTLEPKCCNAMIGSLVPSWKCLVATMVSFRNIIGCLSRGNYVFRYIRTAYEVVMISALFSEEASSETSMNNEVAWLPLRHIGSPPAVSGELVALQLSIYFQESSKRDKGVADELLRCKY